MDLFHVNCSMKPYRLHMIICNDSDCSERGSQQLYENLKQLVKDKDLKETVKVSKSTCLDDCEIGPNLLVYPQGIIYNKVEAQDLEKILTAHLNGEKASTLEHHQMLQ